jgi:hypothetical protein
MIGWICHHSARFRKGIVRCIQDWIGVNPYFEVDVIGIGSILSQICLCGQTFEASLKARNLEVSPEIIHESQ